MTIKNQISKLEKGFSGLLHEGKIREDSELMSIWKEVEQFCPWFYRMKNMVKDKFDDIGAAITNIGGEIELDLMGGRKSAVPNDVGSSPVPLLPLENMDQERNRENSPPWPIDNKLKEDETSDVEELGSQKTLQFLVLGLASGTGKKSAPKPSAPTFPSSSAGGLRKKSAVLDQLTEGLKEVGVAKYGRKKAFDASVQETERVKVLEETKRFAIREQADIKRRRIETERELENRRSALQERKMALRKKEYPTNFKAIIRLFLLE